MDEVKHFGKYEILEELGKGGFGTVYRVREPVLNIERAIKVLHPNLLSDDSFLTRFKHEAQVSAHLEHSNIVPVYELDQVDGLNYIVMKYMPGGSLIDLLRRQGHLDLEETLPYFENMCAGVQFAHKNGVIHRDLKPNNLLIDEFDHMRVSDFGFAKAMASGDSASMSSTGSLIGTPAYMAPEIWRGKPATAQSDIYSLGCILYEMLTGKVLFEGESPAEVITKHVIDGPIYDEDFPLTIRMVLDKALQRDPAKRYMDAKSFLEEYRSLLEPVQETPLGETEEPKPDSTNDIAADSSGEGQKPETTNDTSLDSIVEPQEQVDEMSKEGELFNETVTGEDSADIEPPVQYQSESTSQIEDQTNPGEGQIHEEVKKNDLRSKEKNWDVPTFLILGSIVIGVILYFFSISGTLLNKSSHQVSGTERFRLEAKDGWSSTGINVSTGDVIRIKYLAGNWSPWPGGYFDAMGDTTSSLEDTANVMVGCKHGALIAQIGIGTSSRFCIGINDFSMKANYGGILYLSINDNVLEDDSGSIDLSITINGVPAK